MTRGKSRRTQRPPLWPVLLMVVGGLLILGAIGWTIYAASQPQQSSQLAPVAQDDYPDVPRLSLAESRAALDAGQVVFVDVRDALSFAESHIPGALNIPVDEISQRMGELDKNDWIVTYCT